MTNDRYIPGVPCWIDTTQPDPEAAAAFYGGLFGWEFEDLMPPGSPGKYYVARIRGGDVAAVSSQPEGAPEGAVWNTYVWVEDADETTAEGARRRRHGPDASRSTFAAPAGWRSSRTRQAPPSASGRRRSTAAPRSSTSTARSTSTTSAPATSTARGRSTAPSSAGSVIHGSFWALPGYGDFLEQRNPGMREGMADMGAPERFEDVVASVNLIAEDQPDTPAHWGVTFAVDDADAVAARAAELGGSVVVPPFDAPWVRMTIISDPQGATFTASKFVPENKDLRAR